MNERTILITYFIKSQSLHYQTDFVEAETDQEILSLFNSLVEVIGKRKNLNPVQSKDYLDKIFKNYLKQTKIQ